MQNQALCRIGVFYDGWYFTRARYYFYKQGYGWLKFLPLHRLIEDFIRTKEQSYVGYKVVYSSWFQGVRTSNQDDHKQLKQHRNLLYNLALAGIETKFHPMSKSGKNEKGADVSLALDALQVGLEGKLDIAVLVTGDADFVPLARMLMKQGIRVMVAYVDYEHEGHRQFANERLLKAVNYELALTAVEKDKTFGMAFKGLFHKFDD